VIGWGLTVGDIFEEGEERPRDNKVDDAKAVLLPRFFPEDGRAVYYGRQLEIALERDFFHWITKKALNELAAERSIKFAVEETEHHRAHSIGRGGIAIRGGRLGRRWHL
jgi:hypothetical protein